MKDEDLKEIDDALDGAAKELREAYSANSVIIIVTAEGENNSTEFYRGYAGDVYSMVGAARRAIRELESEDLEEGEEWEQ